MNYINYPDYLIIYTNDMCSNTCECGSSMRRKYNLFFFGVGKLICLRPNCFFNKKK